MSIPIFFGSMPGIMLALVGRHGVFPTVNGEFLVDLLLWFVSEEGRLGYMVGHPVVGAMSPKVSPQTVRGNLLQSDLTPKSRCRLQLLLPLSKDHQLVTARGGQGAFSARRGNG
jgi:hypothetical protein